MIAKRRVLLALALLSSLATNGFDSLTVVAD
jgi:hypothetical protein